MKMLGKDEMSKMGPSILIALAKKKGKKDDAAEDDKGGEEMDMMEHMKMIASDLIKALEDKDEEAVAELLMEAVECCSSSHSEE